MSNRQLSEEEKKARLVALWDAGKLHDGTALSGEDTAEWERLADIANNGQSNAERAAAVSELIKRGWHDPVGDTTKPEETIVIDASAPKRLDPRSRNHERSTHGGYKGKAHYGRVERDQTRAVIADAEIPSSLKDGPGDF